MGFEPTRRVTVGHATGPTSRPVAFIRASRFYAIHRFQFTLSSLILAIAFCAIDFSVVVPVLRSTAPSRLVNWGVALVASGYLFAAFLTIAGAESAESNRC